MKITVMLSGGGSNFQAISNAIQSGYLSGVELIKVVADRECHGINRAIDLGIDYSIVSRSSSTFEMDLTNQIPKETDYIVLAGFLSIIPDSLINQFPNRIINIHPSLLPQFGGKGMYGMHVHEAVIQSGNQVSGCTVHFVDYGIDTGQILFQRKVRVEEGDTAVKLQSKVLIQEHQILPIALKYLYQFFKCDFPNAALKVDMPISSLFVKQGIKTFRSACHYVKNLPYQQTSIADGVYVIKEKGGSCSTKHHILKRLAIEYGLSEVEMKVGLFKMDGEKLPRVAKVLEKYGLDYIPEMHTFFRVQEQFFDFTFSESFDFPLLQNIEFEQEIEPSQIGAWKDSLHREYLEKYQAQEQLDYSIDELWTIRQECVAALFTSQA